MENKNEEFCLLEVRSGMYGEPLTTNGTVENEGARTVYTDRKSVV